jgi:hypothetical protein
MLTGVNRVYPHRRAELAFEIHILLSTSAMKEFLFGKKVAAIWLILSSIAGFVFGPGFCGNGEGPVLKVHG